MVIKQNFYLPLKTQAIIEKLKKSKNYQLKIEKAIKIITNYCGLDFCDTELNLIDTISSKIKTLYSRAIIIAIGGSMSSSRAFAACKNYHSDEFKVIYSDSLSYEKQEEIFNRELLKNTAIIIISRSGNSVETLYQTDLAIERYEQYFGKNYPLGTHFFFITKGNNLLQEKALKIGANIFDYSSKGGKFSSFSMVGLLPASLLGLNPAEIINAAKIVLQNPESAANAALVNYHLLEQGYNINVMCFYNDLFEQMFTRYMQISGELIAKDGKGFSAIVSNGIFDQHGLWQLFLSGPQDKYFTFLFNEADIKADDIRRLIEKTYHELNLKRLKEKDIPTRELIIEQINSYSLGALSMQLLLEMVILADLLGVSAIDQPDIEKSKKVLGEAYSMAKL